MAKTPSKAKKDKKTKKDKSVKKTKKRKSEDDTEAETVSKKKRTKLDAEAVKPKKGKAKKVKKVKKSDTPKKKTKKSKKKKLEETAQVNEETPKKKKKKKGTKSKGSTEKKKKKKKKKQDKDAEAVAEKSDEETQPTAEVEENEVKEAETQAEAEKVTVATSGGAEEDGATVKCFVKNLSWDIDEATIKKFFEDCGTITDVFWLEDKESGKFLGKGFITFETVDQARKAYAKSDQECMGRPIQIDYARPRESNNGGGREARALSERPEGCTTVFLGNLSFDIEEDTIKDFAKDCGEVKTIRWLTDRNTGDFKGCGFCEFATTEAVDKFIKLNGQRVMGRPIRIDYAQSRKTGQGNGGGGRAPKPLGPKPEGCTTVFVGNVSFDIEDSNIHDLAKECGGIKNIRWLTDRETQEFKGCGFVEFYDTEAVDKFVVHNGKDVLGRAIRIDYAKPRPPRE